MPTERWVRDSDEIPLEVSWKLEQKNIFLFKLGLMKLEKEFVEIKLGLGNYYTWTRSF